MSYHALWLKGQKVVADDEFEDVLEAQKFVLDRLSSNRFRRGSTRVKVCDSRVTYFQIDKAAN